MSNKEIILRNISVTYQDEKETWYIDGVETPKNEVVDYISPNKAILAAPDTSELVFKPEYDVKYDFVNDKGQVVTMLNTNDMADKRRLKVGNVFRVCEAHSSAKYYIMNSEYDYWFPWSGQPEPKVLPKGLEYYTDSGRWKSSDCVYPSNLSIYGVYRWKRSEQV